MNRLFSFAPTETDPFALRAPPRADTPAVLATTSSTSSMPLLSVTSATDSTGPTAPPLTAARLFGNDRFYVSGSAVAGLPSFPDDWQKKPLDPAGTMNPAGQDKHVPYNVEWLEQWRIRQMFVETDLLYQFVTKVAARTGKNTDTYFRGGATASDALEALMVNVVTNALHQQVMADTVAIHDPSRPIDLSAIEGLSRAATAFVRGAAQRAVQAGTAELQPSEVPEQMSEAASAQREALWSTALKAFRQRAEPTTAPAAPLLKAPATVSARTIPLRRPAQTMRDPDDMLQPPPVYDEYAPLSASAMAARAAALKPPAALPDHSAMATEGLRDARVMLTYLLLRGGISKTEMDAVEKIYGPAQLVLQNRDRIKQTLDDAQKLERMLRRSPALDWMEAPQHTGFLFFSPAFTAAVDSAMRDVHHTCNKPFAFEIDLMTHEEVCTDFADLVAYHLQQLVDQRLSRFGGGKDASAKSDRVHRSLILKFRKLGQTERALPVPGQFLTFTGMDGQQIRQDTEEERRKYMIDKHKYYSDRYQQRPTVLQQQASGARPAASVSVIQQRIDRSDRTYTTQ